MSAGGSVDRCEPNLTPLLDLVLQLVMFFMLCANFVAESVNPTIVLPKAISAKPIDKGVKYQEILNVDKKGRVLLGKDDEKGIEGYVAIKSYMKNQFQVAESYELKKNKQAWERGENRPSS